MSKTHRWSEPPATSQSRGGEGGPALREAWTGGASNRWGGLPIGQYSRTGERERACSLDADALGDLDSLLGVSGGGQCGWGL